MSFLDDIFQPEKDMVDATINAVTGQSPPQSASTPQFSAPPSAPSAAAPWTAPDASGNGELSVHRDTLRSVASNLQAYLPELDSLVSQVQAAASGFGSLQTWPTGSSFSANAMNACQAVAQAGTQTGDTQNSTAKNLTDTASVYDAAESANTQSVSNVGNQLNAYGGSVSAASGI